MVVVMATNGYVLPSLPHQSSRVPISMIAFLAHPQPSRYHFSLYLPHVACASFMDSHTDRYRWRPVPTLINRLPWLVTSPTTKRMGACTTATERAFTCSHATRYATPPQTFLLCSSAQRSATRAPRHWTDILRAHRKRRIAWISSTSSSR